MANDLASPRGVRRFDILVLGAAVLVCFLAYARAVGGDFVYDDSGQITQNSLIQRGEFFSRALLSPVWSYLEEGHEGNYWRPTFTAWTILNYRLFGLNPAGWHLADITLHALVTVLLYLLLLRLQLRRELAAVVSLLFAVHPTHVESVAWISGSPSMLLGAATLGTILLFLKAWEARRRTWWALALLVYSVALLAKESAIVLPALVFLLVTILCSEERSRKRRLRRAAVAAAPFALVAAAYFVIRWAILHGFMQTDPSPEIMQTLLTIPAALAFYARQAVLPYSLSPGYPLRLVSPATLGLRNFLIPCALLVIVEFVMRKLAAKSPHARFGAFLFVLFLIPSLNFAAFGLEDIVHDRYLYLPSAGMLLVVVCGLDLIRQRLSRFTAKLGIALAGVAGIFFFTLTARYVPVWTSSEALWSYCTEADPTSANCLARYAEVLMDQGRTEEARTYLDRSIEIRIVPSSLILRAELAQAEGRMEDSEQDLLRVLSRLREVGAESPDVYERLAILYQEERRFDDGIELLREGRQRIPERYCHFTDKIAALLVQAGREDEAIQELEAVRDRVPEELNDYSRMVLYTLALLYREKGEIGKSLVALEDFVTLSADCTAPRVVEARQEAIAMLGY